MRWVFEALIGRGRARLALEQAEAARDDAQAATFFRAPLRPPPSTLSAPSLPSTLYNDEGGDCTPQAATRLCCLTASGWLLLADAAEACGDAEAAAAARGEAVQLAGSSS